MSLSAMVFELDEFLDRGGKSGGVGFGFEFDIADLYFATGSEMDFDGATVHFGEFEFVETVGSGLDPGIGSGIGDDRSRLMITRIVIVVAIGIPPLFENSQDNRLLVLEVREIVGRRRRSLEKRLQVPLAHRRLVQCRPVQFQGQSPRFLAENAEATRRGHEVTLHHVLFDGRELDGPGPRPLEGRGVALRCMRRRLRPRDAGNGGCSCCFGHVC